MEKWNDVVYGWSLALCVIVSDHVRVGPIFYKPWVDLD